MTIVICDDDKHIRSELKALTTALGFSAQTFACAASLQDALKTMPTPQAILLDLVMPECDGVQLLRQLLAHNLPVIILTSLKNEAAGLHGVHLGAQDYLTKPLNPLRVEMALRQLRLKVSAQIAPFIAASPRLKTMLTNAQKAFLTPSPLLIEGAAATGKTAFAQEIIRTSLQANIGFITLDAKQLETCDLETELNALTPTIRIIDHCEKLSPACQNLLLSHLNKPNKKLGKFIFIAGQSLLTQVQQGKFNAALYYHLAIHPFSMPHFRAEPLDFSAIATHFHGEAMRQYGGKSLQPKLALLLENPIITHYTALKREITQSLLLETLPALCLYNAEGFRPLAQLEAEIYSAALSEGKGQMSEIARKLGIGRTTLYRKLVEFGLMHPMKHAA